MTSETHQAVDQAKDTALDKIDEAKSKGGDLVRDQVDQRSTQAGERVASTADDIRAVGETLRDRGDDTAARIAERAAGYAQQAADYLRDTGPNQIISDVEAFARKEPWVVALGGLIVGFAASRVLRSSARGDEDENGRGHEDQPQHPADRMGDDAPAVVQQAAERDAYRPQPGVGDPDSGLAQPSVAPGVGQGDFGDGPAGTRQTTPGGLGGTP